MAFKRRLTFKRKRVVRRRPKTALKKANLALRQVNRIKPELKIKHVLQSNISVPDIAGTSLALTAGIERGVGPDQRVGSAIRPLYLNGHSFIHGTTVTHSYYVRMLVVRMKQTAVSVNPPQDWPLEAILDLESGIPATLAPKLWAVRKNFDVLYDRRVNINLDRDTKLWKYNIRLGGRVTQYRDQDSAGPSTAPTSNSYRMYFITDANSDVALKVTSDFRFFYTDA